VEKTKEIRCQVVSGQVEELGKIHVMYVHRVLVQIQLHVQAV